MTNENYLCEIDEIICNDEILSERSMFLICKSSEKCLKILMTSTLLKTTILNELNVIFKSYFELYLKNVIKQRKNGR